MIREYNNCVHRITSCHACGCNKFNWNEKKQTNTLRSKDVETRPLTMLGFFVLLSPLFFLRQLTLYEQHSSINKTSFRIERIDLSRAKDLKRIHLKNTALEVRPTDNIMLSIHYYYGNDIFTNSSHKAGLALIKYTPNLCVVCDFVYNWKRVQLLNQNCQFWIGKETSFTLHRQRD